jgi:hypothetical protein
MFLNTNSFYFILFLKGIVLKFDPARQVDLGLKLGQVKKK